MIKQMASFPAPPRPGSDWFSDLFGFAETDPSSVHTFLSVERDVGRGGDVLVSKVNGHRYFVGQFACPSLGELRKRAAALPKEEGGPPLSVEIVYGDVSRFHAEPENRLAVFQAASQFNCLEFVGPGVTPEQGVTAYTSDRTQGPACSVAAGPATVIRNYFVQVTAERTVASGQVVAGEGEEGKQGSGGGGGGGATAAAASSHGLAPGQRADKQIDNARDLLTALGNYGDGSGDDAAAGGAASASVRLSELGVARVSPARYMVVRGGYTMATNDGLAALNKERLDGKSDAELDQYRSLLRIGVHSDVQVTSYNWGRNRVGGPLPAAAPGADGGDMPPQLVTQVFGSACACQYSGNSRRLWAPFAKLVLEASYEATLLAALENAFRHEGRAGSRRVYLTLLGGGVFGNSIEWIADAIRRACLEVTAAGGRGLEIKIVQFRPGNDDPRIQALTREFPVSAAAAGGGGARRSRQ